MIEMKTLYYKNLILTSKGIMFDTNQFKVYALDEEHVLEFIKLLNHEVEEKDSIYYDKLLITKKKFKELKIIKINMTNYCNLKCKYCFANEGTYNKINSSFSSKLISNLTKLLIQYPSIEYITFFGGEPLLNIEGIIDICEVSRKVREDIKFYCQTNGTIMTNKIKKAIDKFDLKFTISIDGAKEDNDRNRIFKNNTGTFDIIKKNYDFFKSNVQSIEATYDGASKYSKNEIADYLSSEFECTNIAVCNLIGDEKTCYKVNPKKEIEEILQNNYIPINKTKELLIGFFSKVNQYFFCSAGSQLINIDSDGKIYPCHLLIDKKDKYVLGDLVNFNKLEFDSNRYNFIKNLDKDNYEKCSSCCISWNCAKCYGAKEKFDFENCEIMLSTYMEIFEEIADEIIKGRLDLILSKLEGAIKYV